MKALFTFLLFLGVPRRLYAAETLSCGEDGLAGVLMNLESTPSAMVNFLMVISLVIGVWMFVAGFIGAVGGSDSNRTTTASSWLKIIGGALLLNVGLMLAVVTGTVLGPASGMDPEGLKDLHSVMFSNCVNNVATGSNGDLTDVTTAVLNSVTSPFLLLINSVSVMVGLIFLISALLSVAKMRENSQSASDITFGGILYKLVFGALLLNMPWMYSIISNSVAGVYDSSNLIQSMGCYTSGQSASCDPNSAEFDTRMLTLLQAILLFLVPFGLIALISGLIGLNRVMTRPQNAQAEDTKSAFVKIIAGIIMMNMSGLLCALENTPGLSTIMTDAAPISFCTMEYKP